MRTLRTFKGLENVKVPIKQKTDSQGSLLNFQISTVANDYNNKLHDSALNTIDSLRNKTAEILSSPKNPELELDFRATFSAYQSNSHPFDPSLLQAYQVYLTAYQQKTSLYSVWENDDDMTILIVYNTETETKEIKIMQAPELLNHGTCIAQLPNGKLFCFGKYPPSGITILINLNDILEVLPSGTSCYDSSCIYFNNSIYCFGGKNEDDESLTLSSRFDLYQNRSIQLTPLPQIDSLCNSIIFNGNILISGFSNRNILLYSIDINSFSTIPYEFAAEKRKILINAERLYLIECDKGSIYESEIGSDTNWRRIGDSNINYNPCQAYCSYNKGGLYIVIDGDDYFKFDLNQKRLTKLK